MSDEPSEQPNPLEELQLRLLEILPNATPACPWVVADGQEKLARCNRCGETAKLKMGALNRFILHLRLFTGLHQWCEPNRNPDA